MIVRLFLNGRVRRVVSLDHAHRVFETLYDATSSPIDNYNTLLFRRAVVVAAHTDRQVKITIVIITAYTFYYTVNCDIVAGKHR